MKQTIWVLSLLLIAAVTAALQLDRQSRYAPEWAKHVPEPARYFAQAHLTVEALQEEDAGAAIAAADTLLARRPIPAENMRLYAQAQLKQGNAEQGLRGLQLAAQRGWREPVTQEAMARIAWAAGNPADAANRLAALYAREADSIVLGDLAEEVLSNPAGRVQMATLLAGGARWESRFVRLARRDTSYPTYNAVLLAAHEKGARFTCAPLREAARRQARDAGIDAKKTPLAPLLERNC